MRTWRKRRFLASLWRTARRQTTWIRLQALCRTIGYVMVSFQGVFGGFLSSFQRTTLCRMVWSLLQAAGAWLLLYTGEYIFDEEEVRKREEAAIRNHGSVCYVWPIDDARVPQKCLLDAAENGGLHSAFQHRRELRHAMVRSRSSSVETHSERN